MFKVNDKVKINVDVLRSKNFADFTEGTKEWIENNSDTILTISEIHHFDNVNDDYPYEVIGDVEIDYTYFAADELVLVEDK